MITIVGINPLINPRSNKSYMYISTQAFDIEYLELKSFDELKHDKEIIIFHPREKNDNPDWVKVEDFSKFDFPEDAYYVFNSDYGDIISEIHNTPDSVKKKIRWVKIPTTSEGFKSLHGHQAVAIVGWEIFKRKNKATLEGNTW